MGNESDQYSTAGSYVTGGEFNRDTNYIEDRIVADASPRHRCAGPPAVAGAGRQVPLGRRAGLPWANRTLIHRRLLGLEDALSLGDARPPHPRRPVLDLRPVSRRGRSGAGGCTGCRRRTSTASTTTPPGASRCRRSWISGPRPWSPTTTPRSPWTSTPNGPRCTATVPPRALSGQASRGDRRGQQAGLHRGQQRGLSVWLRRVAGGVRVGVRAAVHRAGLARGAAERPALPGRGTRSPRPTSGCSPRWPGSIRSTTATSSATGRSCRSSMPCGRTPGTCSRPPRLRRHDRFRADQAALLHGPRGCEPDPDRADGPLAGELADPARPGGSRRTPVRGRHPAASAPRPADEVPYEHSAEGAGYATPEENAHALANK